MKHIHTECEPLSSVGFRFTSTELRIALDGTLANSKSLTGYHVEGASEWTHDEGSGGYSCECAMLKKEDTILLASYRELRWQSSFDDQYDYATHRQEATVLFGHDPVAYAMFMTIARCAEKRVLA